VREQAKGEPGGVAGASAKRAAHVLTSQSASEIEPLRSENSRLEAEQSSAGDLTADVDGSLDIFGLHLEAHLHVEIDVERDFNLAGIGGGLLGAIFG
jgi:hypothetical protein